MDIRIELSEMPTEDERSAVLAPLAAFNDANGYPADTAPLAVLLRDPCGEIVGGLWGKTGYGWLFIEFLSVPESLRGQDLGTKLMMSAEREARQRGCIGAWLTTFSFQAQGFYEKLGYSLLGQLDESPGANVRLFLRKRFSPVPAPFG